MHDDFALPIEYVRPIADQLRSMGVDVDAWLARSDLDEKKLARPGGVLPYPAFRELVLDALAAAREPALGLFVGRRIVASTHGIVGAAAVNASTVLQAIDVAEKFSRLRSSLITISHEVGPRDGRVIFKEVLPLGDIRRPVLEAVVLSIKTILDDITMGAARMREVAFAFEAPEYAALARDIFGCNVRYGQSWTGYVGALDQLDLPLKLADPAAFEEAARICQRELDLIAAQETTSARVRRLLLENQTGFPSLQVTARLLHMTPRTLHRRLVEEGTSYRDILSGVRRTLAIEHIRSDRFTLEEVAYRLGYTDMANFRRAFKRWEGAPPSTYRGSYQR